MKWLKTATKNCVASVLKQKDGVSVFLKCQILLQSFRPFCSVTAVDSNFDQSTAVSSDNMDGSD